MTEREYDAWRAKVRRNTLADAKLCINGIAHGPATHGVRCEWCAAVHKFGAAIAFAQSIPRPVGHRLKLRGNK